MFGQLPSRKIVPRLGLGFGLGIGLELRLGAIFLEGNRHRTGGTDTVFVKPSSKCSKELSYEGSSILLPIEFL